MRLRISRLISKPADVSNYQSLKKMNVLVAEDMASKAEAVVEATAGVDTAVETKGMA